MDPSMDPSMDPHFGPGPWTPGRCFILTHFVDMSIFTPNTRQVLPKLQSIIEFLSLNLSDLCNKISLCNIIDNSAAKNSIKKGRLYKEKENEFVMFMLRRVNKMQPSQSNWNFPDFPPVPLSKPELLKLTIVMKIEMYYLTRRQRCQFPP